MQINCFALPTIYHYKSTTIYLSDSAKVLCFFPLDNQEVVKKEA